jgi:hypothetical protein
MPPRGTPEDRRRGGAGRVCLRLYASLGVQVQFPYHQRCSFLLL